VAEVSFPFCLFHCLPVSLNLFPSSSSSLLEHTHSSHSSTLRKSLHPLPISSRHSPPSSPSTLLLSTVAL
uniref:Uncharacterized protein n=1 Tax=Sparus aurata TaxID=8175 RepID=A0A671UZV6_SPAAU